MYFPLFPYSTLILRLIAIGIRIALSSNNLLLIWVGIEVNLLSFIPLISASNNNQETEARVKYFLIQAVRSGVFLFTIASILNKYKLTLPIDVAQILLFLSIRIKAGIAPCYFWFPQVINAMNWLMCLLLSTTQKFIPLLLIFNLILVWSPYLLLSVCVLNRLVGSIGGLNQTQIRPLLAYSSIGHISWIVTIRAFSSASRFSYFSIYILITSRIILLIISTHKTNTGQFNISILNTSNATLLLILSFLSLAGLPPLLGFFPKWLVISYLSSVSPLFIAILMSGSLVTLFYYLLIFFSRNLNSMKNIKTTTKTYTLPFIASISISSILLLITIYALARINKS